MATTQHKVAPAVHACNDSLARGAWVGGALAEQDCKDTVAPLVAHRVKLRGQTGIQ